MISVANLMTQPGETAGFTVADHVRAIADHGVRVTDGLVPAERLPTAVARRLAERGAAAVEVDEPQLEALGVRVRRARLAARSGTTTRHDARRLGRAVRALAEDRIASRAHVPAQRDRGT